MAETSLFWDGTTVGDATTAAYSSQEFTRAFNKILGSDGAGYVIPGYANSLNVQASSPAAATVDVATGAALVKGFLYENDTLKTLTLAANASGNPRIDRVVLQVNFGAQTVRLAILQGTPAAAPALPALTQTYGTTWEISLGYIWVANGFATIADTEIHDEREFIITAKEARRLKTRKNLVKNSEFILLDTSYNTPAIMINGVWGSDQTGGGSITGFTAVAKPSQQTRGNAFRFTSPIGGAGAIFQLIPCRPSTTYAIKALINPASAGAEIEAQGSTGFATLLKRSIRFTNVWTEEQLIVTTGAADTYIKFIYRGVANTNITVGQAVIVEGFIPGEFEPVHEYIPCSHSAVNASWDMVAKSTGNTDIDMTATAWGRLSVFSLNDIRAVQFLLAGRDTGSAAAADGACEMEIKAYGGGGPAPGFVKINLAGIANSRRVHCGGVMPVWTNSAITTFVLGFRIVVTATGAGSFSAGVYITGVYT